MTMSDPVDAQEETFVKEGVVRPGKTPSVVSGEKSELVKEGQAYRAGEKEVESVELLADDLD